MNTPATSQPEFFEAMYKVQADPWNFAGSAYELSRYEAILATIPPRRYKSIFEPGCSVGVLTERLASLSDKVVAIDFSSAAVHHARARCGHLPNVEISCASLPEYTADRMEAEAFDLILLSEIGYYFSPTDWRILTSRIVGAMQPAALLLAAHWLGQSPDHQIDGDTVHSILQAHPHLVLEHSERHSDARPDFRLGFRIDRWIRK